MLQKIRWLIFDVIENPDHRNVYGAVFSMTVIIITILNIVMVVLESFHEISIRFAPFFYLFELILIVFFTLEYILRIATADLKYHKGNILIAMLSYISSPMALIDLLAILPFYVPMLITMDMRFIRIVKLLRLFRVFKLHRYASSMQRLARVLRNKKEELIVSVFVILIMLMFSATCMFYLEHDLQPDAFPHILATLWWAIQRITQTGHAEITPVTIGGKFLSGINAFLGISLIIFPTAIITAGFIEEQKNEQRDPNRQCCPFCGKKIGNKTRSYH